MCGTCIRTILFKLWTKLLFVFLKSKCIYTLHQIFIERPVHLPKTFNCKEGFKSSSGKKIY